MALSESQIIALVTVSPVTGSEFETAVAAYLRLMEEDGDEGTDGPDQHPMVSLLRQCEQQGQGKAYSDRQPRKLQG